jgi:hypothetical protein
MTVELVTFPSAVSVSEANSSTLAAFICLHCAGSTGTIIVIIITDVHSMIF